MRLKIITIVSFLLFTISNTYAQTTSVTLSGVVKNKANKLFIPFANIVLQKRKDSAFVTGTVTNEEGRFALPNIPSGNYILQYSYIGLKVKYIPVLVGSLSTYLDLGTIELEPDAKQLEEIVVTAKQDDVSNKLDKKSFAVGANITQSGGSVLQALKNLPGVTTSQDGKVELRGSDKVAVLIDGKQTALTGFGSQTGLDNIPASAIERIEIINNPSAKYDANGNAGIVNIIYKKISNRALTARLV